MVFRLFFKLFSILEASWGVLGASWGVLATSWARLGGVLGRLGPSWGRLGTSWSVLGAMLVRFSSQNHPKHKSASLRSGAIRHDLFLRAVQY